jgi:hypothetical protein
MSIVVLLIPSAKPKQYRSGPLSHRMAILGLDGVRLDPEDAAAMPPRSPDTSVPVLHRRHC